MMQSLDFFSVLFPLQKLGKRAKLEACNPFGKDSVHTPAVPGAGSAQGN